VLGAFLEEAGASHLFEPLSYCVRELAVNAQKANTKRLYFESRSLDPTDPAQYAHGMIHFKRDTLDEQKLYRDLLRERGLSIKIELIKRQNALSLAVRNSVEVLPSELIRVRQKIIRARKLHSLDEVLEEFVDESEGAGLGILVLILMFKKLGFTGDFFQFYAVGGHTVARILLPLTPPPKSSET
jgi:hypothetical protein